MYFNFVGHESGTMIKILKQGRIEKHWQFYSLPVSISNKFTTVDEASAELKQGLATAVERQMVSDVPVGAFDASTVLSVA